MTRILIIDDELAITDLLESVLIDEGYQAMTASHGREGLACLAQQPIDLILSDIMMPVMDGRDFCLAVQQDARYQHIPVVLMSAVRETMIGTECRYAAFITKPFDFDAVLATIARLTNASAHEASA